MHDCCTACQRRTTQERAVRYAGHRRGTWDGKLIIHPRDLWIWGSNLTGGSQLAKLPSFGGNSLENLKPMQAI